MQQITLGLLLCLLLAACTVGVIQREVLTPGASPSTLDGSMATARPNSTIVTPVPPFPTVTRLPTQPPRPVTVPPLSDPLAGLVYHTKEGLWMLDVGGKPKFLIDQPAGRLSPDGRQVAYWYWEGDGANNIWLMDLSTGARRNLTQSSGRVNRDAQWWPARPDVIVFHSSTDVMMWPGTGDPTLVKVDGSNYRIMDEGHGTDFALSPDGLKIACGGYGSIGRLYTWGVGAEPFDPAAYGMSVEELYKPAWSPDGYHLAWRVRGNLTGDGKQRWGVAVFNLKSKSSRLLHAYELRGGGSWPSYLSWSPDGQWLAFVN